MLIGFSSNFRVRKVWLVIWVRVFVRVVIMIICWIVIWVRFVILLNIIRNIWFGCGCVVSRVWWKWNFFLIVRVVFRM